MQLIEPVSNLSIKRSVNLFSIILFLSFGAMLYWLATDRYLEFTGTHEKTADIAIQIPSLDSSIENFIKRADKALYQAKDAGRDQWILHRKKEKTSWASNM